MVIPRMEVCELILDLLLEVVVVGVERTRSRCRQPSGENAVKRRDRADILIIECELYLESRYPERIAIVGQNHTARAVGEMLRVVLEREAVDRLGPQYAREMSALEVAGARKGGRFREKGRRPANDDSPVRRAR
jgi:hypothetical protein